MTTTLGTVMENIERGEYGPDPETWLLFRLAVREGEKGCDNSAVLYDWYDGMERGWQRFTEDALAAVELTGHPMAADIFRFAEGMIVEAGDYTKCLAILRRVATFIANSPPSTSSA